MSNIMKMITKNLYICRLDDLLKYAKNFNYVYNFSEKRNIDSDTLLELRKNGVKTICNFWKSEELFRIKKLRYPLDKKICSRERKILEDKASIIRKDIVQKNKETIHKIANTTQSNKTLFVCENNKIFSPLFCLIVLKINKTPLKHNIFKSDKYKERTEKLLNEYTQYL